jgi:hypothetical protein
MMVLQVALAPLLFCVQFLTFFPPTIGYIGGRGGYGGDDKDEARMERGAGDGQARSSDIG